MRRYPASRALALPSHRRPASRRLTRPRRRRTLPVRRRLGPPPQTPAGTNQGLRDYEPDDSPLLPMSSSRLRRAGRLCTRAAGHPSPIPVAPPRRCRR
jgi:hypothetical protein